MVKVMAFPQQDKDYLMAFRPVRIQREKNFELTDLDEADQIGLTSFNSWTWNSDRVSDDISMWNRSKPEKFWRYSAERRHSFHFWLRLYLLENKEKRKESQWHYSADKILMIY
ncbi:MAG: hypothetical protein MZV64_31155 [Ignavibacteriales bacterium]|nr:hypothetical protein [Ignavibacteriales bacterium]